MLCLRTFGPAAAALVIACGAPKPSASTTSETADLILFGGPIVTMNANRDIAEAIAMAGGTIIAVGDQSTVMSYRGSATEVVDLGGATAYPGFVDSHMHFARLGKRARELYLDETKSPQEAIRIVAEQVATTPKGEWIIGKGWHTVHWGDEYPDNRELSKVAPDHPVYLAGMANHAAWVNDNALKLAGIDESTADPKDGRIVRDDRGRATGILIESAKSLVAKHLPRDDARQRRRDFEASVSTALALGFTQVHDAGSSDADITLYEDLLASGKLGVRLHLLRYVEGDGDDLDAFLANPPRHGVSGRLNVEGIKVYADGALGARGAALLAPYSDAPDTQGMVANDQQALESIITKASMAGYQVATHAIGDRGNRAVLDAVEAVRQRLGSKVRRPRIEHAQVIAPDDIPRFAKLGVIAAMQPIHCTMDQGFAESRLGPERIRGAYAWRSLLDSGATIAASADTPAFPIKYSNPLWGIHAAVTRDGFYPEQRVTVDEALVMYTSAGASAGFNEDVTGALEKGMYGDVTILSKNLYEVIPDDIRGVEVVMTIVDGAIAYDARAAR